MDFLNEALKIEKQLVTDRRFFHQNAELGDNLPVTSTYIKKRLDEMGILYKEITPCGIVATLGKDKGKIFMLRADCDALPMEEENDLPFRSKTPYAHTCGHDNHMTMLLGAAQILKNKENEINGTVKLVFQPNEEGLFGAVNMVNAGLMDCNPSAAMALHVDALQPLGKIKFGYGNCFASNDFFDIIIKGKGAHGAKPHESIDPVNVAAFIQQALNCLISRESDLTETNVLTIASIESEGKAHNIIPEKAVLRGTLRTYNGEQRQFIKKRIEEISYYIAKAFRACADVNFLGGINCVHCDEKLTEELKKYTCQILGSEKLDGTFKRMGSEDFAYIAEKVNSGYLFIGAGTDEKTGHPFGQHNKKVIHNEKVLPMGAAVMAGCAYMYLKNNN